MPHPSGWLEVRERGGRRKRRWCLVKGTSILMYLCRRERRVVGRIEVGVPGTLVTEWFAPPPAEPSAFDFLQVRILSLLLYYAHVACSDY